MPEIFELNGQLYEAKQYTTRDLFNAAAAYNAREISQPEYDQRDRDRIKRIREYVENGVHKLIPLEMK